MNLEFSKAYSSTHIQVLYFFEIKGQSAQLRGFLVFLKNTRVITCIALVSYVLYVRYEFDTLLEPVLCSIEISLTCGFF